MSENVKTKTISPIAYIKTDFSEKFGIPRQSGRVPELTAEIVFYDHYRNKDALREIEGFSHLWLLFDFDRNAYTSFSPSVRPPRLGGNKKVGVFASRSPFRPNGIGLSCVKLLEVKNTDKDGVVLVVGGADLADRTPIYDIKPYIPSSDCVINAHGGYSEDFTDYKLEVIVNDEQLLILPTEKRKALIGCLSEDPRPSYKQDGEEYGMQFCGFNVRFTVENAVLTVLQIDKI